MLSRKSKVISAGLAILFVCRSDHNSWTPGPNYNWGTCWSRVNVLSFVWKTENVWVDFLLRKIKFPGKLGSQTGFSSWYKEPPKVLMTVNVGNDPTTVKTIIVKNLKFSTTIYSFRSFLKVNWIFWNSKILLRELKILHIIHI